jgi:hypothetical protein
MELPPVISPSFPLWEYKTIKMSVGGTFAWGILDTVSFDSELNQMGAIGWELVAAFNTNQVQGASRDAVAIFKRPRKV